MTSGAAKNDQSAPITWPARAFRSHAGEDNGLVDSPARLDGSVARDHQKSTPSALHDGARLDGEARPPHEDIAFQDVQFSAVPGRVRSDLCRPTDTKGDALALSGRRTTSGRSVA